MESYRGNIARCLGGMFILILAARESQLKEGKISGGIATEKDTRDLQLTGRLFAGRVGMSENAKVYAKKADTTFSWEGRVWRRR